MVSCCVLSAVCASVPAAASSSVAADDIVRAMALTEVSKPSEIRCSSGAIVRPKKNARADCARMMPTIANPITRVVAACTAASAASLWLRTCSMVSARAAIEGSMPA